MNGFDSAAGVAATLLVGWTCASLVMGGAMLFRDGSRRRRARPAPATIRIYADRLQTLHGPDALRRVGEAMHKAREHADFDRHRFLRDVSAELARRMSSAERSRFQYPSR